MSRPRIAILTKFGPLSLTPTDSDHIYAAAGTRYEIGAESGLTVRGVRYHVSAHCYRADGFKSRPAEFYVSRAGSFGRPEPSRAARETIADEISRAVAAWTETEDARAAFAIAEFQDAEKALQDAREKSEKADAAAAECLAARIAAAKRLKDAAARFEIGTADRNRADVLARAYGVS